MAQLTERRLAAIHGAVVTVAVGDDVASDDTNSMAKKL
jgi:hypothetical protein